MDKPKKRYTTFTRREGHFDFAHPGREEVAYRFVWAEDETPKLKRSFCIKLSSDWGSYPDTSSALALARTLEDYHASKLYSSDSAEIRAVVAYLEARESQDILLEAEYDIEEARYKLEHWKQELSDRERYLEAVQAEPQPA